MKRAMKIILALVTITLIARLAHLRAGVSVAPDADTAGGADALLAAGAAIGTLLLGAWFAGKLVSLIGLPKITGYLVFGLVAGPYGVEAITKSQLNYLQLINDFAVSLIALTAGGEIRLSILRRSARTISAILLLQIFTVMIGVTAVAYLALPPLAGIETDSNAQLLVVAVLVAAVCTLSSPAAVIAVLAETRAKGPVASMTLAVTVCKDMALIVIFAVAVAVATGVIDPSSRVSVASADTWISIAAKLLGSIGVGAMIGVLLTLLLRRVKAHLPLLIVFTCFGIAVVCESLHLEPLLMALTTGLLVQNLRRDEAGELFDAMEELSVPVYCIFFALAGAKINPHDLASTWPMALLLVGVRTATVWAGTTAGARLTGLRSPWLPLGFLPQAGVSIALAFAVRETLEGLPLADPVFTILLAAITCNEIVGPALFKLALVRTGEAKSQRA